MQYGESLDLRYRFSINWVTCFIVNTRLLVYNYRKQLLLLLQNMHKVWFVFLSITHFFSCCLQTRSFPHLQAWHSLLPWASSTCQPPASSTCQPPASPSLLPWAQSTCLPPASSTCPPPAWTRGQPLMYLNSFQLVRPRSRPYRCNQPCRYNQSCRYNQPC